MVSLRNLAGVVIIVAIAFGLGAAISGNVPVIDDNGTPTADTADTGGGGGAGESEFGSGVDKTVVPNNPDGYGGSDAGGDGDGSSDSGPESMQDLSLRAIEWAIHNRVNEIRTERGLSRLPMTSKPREAARLHSEDMARNEFLSHISSDGDDLGDRYAEVRYTCRVKTEVGDPYRNGSENIGFTWAFSTYVLDGERVDNNGNETKIAHALVRQWMSAETSRERILSGVWHTEGIGVAASQQAGGIKIYATETFC